MVNAQSQSAASWRGPRSEYRLEGTPRERLSNPFHLHTGMRVDTGAQMASKLMSMKIAFSWRCPKGHNVDDSLPKAKLKDQLVAGRLTARCPHCGGQESAIPAEQLERILKQLST